MSKDIFPFSVVALRKLLKDLELKFSHEKPTEKENFSQTNNCLIFLADKITSVGVFFCVKTEEIRRRKILARVETLPHP